VDGADQDLERTIRDRIERDGPLTFAEFMEVALYDERRGYYARPPIGEDGDYVTSPHVSPAFGVLLARGVEDLWLRMGSPAPFAIVEAAAGDGTLARRLLASLPPELAANADFVAVERSAGARDALHAFAAEEPHIRMVTVHDDLPAEGTIAAGVLIANELLDNLPFHRLRGTVEGPVELRVDRSPADSGFALVESPAPAVLIDIAPALSPGQEAVVSPEALRFLERAAGAFVRGYLLFADYALGGEPATASSGGAVHGYARHRVTSDVLAGPGTRDITAGIDVRALLARGRRTGLRVWDPITQREALRNLGLGAWDRALRERQAQALNDGRGAEATQIYSARNAARLLTDPEGLGAFTMLCFGVGNVPRPGLLLDGTPFVPGAP
jgi:SAM-dependent MidA family methyltransferase